MQAERTDSLPIASPEKMNPREEQALLRQVSRDAITRIGKRGWLRGLAVIILLLFVTEGCVYYNTFYLARKWFKQAESTRKSANRDVYSGDGEKRLYQDAIRKSSKVISESPGSSYVDDALYIIGKSYYYLQDYPKAERKFRELLSSYPKSKYAEESRLFLGKTRFRQENYLLAAEVFNEILETSKNSDWRAEALYFMGEADLKQADSAAAVGYYQRFIKDHKSDSKAPEIQFKIGQIQFESHQYSEAVAAFAQAESMAKDDKAKFQARYEQGRSLYMVDSVAAGLSMFRKMAADPKDTLYLADVLLRVAEGQYLVGEKRETILLYDDIATRYSAAKQAAEAYYRVGLIVADEWGDLELAKDMFDQAAKVQAGGDWRQLAIDKAADIAKVKKYRAELSGEKQESADDNQFMLAELYRTSLNRPDSALSEYLALVDNYPESELAPKAMMAIGWLQEDYLHDTTAALETYRKVLYNYPRSDEYGAALRALGLTDTEVDSLYAEKLYRLAEAQYLDNGNADSAIVLFQRLVDEFPESRLTPRADFAMAKIELKSFVPQEVPDDSTYVDSTMILVFKGLSEKYPDSPFGAEAARLATGELVAKVIRPVEQQPASKDSSKQAGDSTALVAKGDTLTPAQRAEEELRYEIDNTPQITIEEPTTKGEFIYPLNASGSKFEGRLTLKIKIEFDGKVSEVKFLKGSNIPEIDQVVRKAMLETYFDPMQFDPLKLAKGYFVYNYTVVLPEVYK
jgi:TonB family protein